MSLLDLPKLVIFKIVSYNTTRSAYYLGLTCKHIYRMLSGLFEEHSAVNKKLDSSNRNYYLIKLTKTYYMPRKYCTFFIKNHKYDLVDDILSIYPSLLEHVRHNIINANSYYLCTKHLKNKKIFSHTLVYIFTRCGLKIIEYFGEKYAQNFNDKMNIYKCRDLESYKYFISRDDIFIVHTNSILSYAFKHFEFELVKYICENAKKIGFANNYEYIFNDVNSTNIYWYIVENFEKSTFKNYALKNASYEGLIYSYVCMYDVNCFKHCYAETMKENPNFKFLLREMEFYSIEVIKCILDQKILSPDEVIMSIAKHMSHFDFKNENLIDKILHIECVKTQLLNRLDIVASCVEITKWYYEQGGDVNKLLKYAHQNDNSLIYYLATFNKIYLSGLICLKTSSIAKFIKHPKYFVKIYLESCVPILKGDALELVKMAGDDIKLLKRMLKRSKRYSRSFRIIYRRIKQIDRHFTYVEKKVDWFNTDTILAEQY